MRVSGDGHARMSTDVTDIVRAVRVGLCSSVPRLLSGLRDGRGRLDPVAYGPPEQLSQRPGPQSQPHRHLVQSPDHGQRPGRQALPRRHPLQLALSFQAPLGSTSLDSFLRYSAVPETRTSQPQNYTPFYSSTGTVTTTVPGYQGVFSPSSPRIVGSLGQSASRSVDTMATTELRPAPDLDRRHQHRRRFEHGGLVPAAILADVPEAPRR